MLEPQAPPLAVSARIATALLVLFLVAVLAALAITLTAVAPPVRLLAGTVVSPIVTLAVFFLYFERKGRRWSFAGAATLGGLGVCLRLIVSTQPQLEVGGGLPLSVTVLYLTLGMLVLVSSLWACISLRRTHRDGPRSDPAE